ncbi:16S rRNA (adenine(1518)-N(6)/adenine(1519)-N(6))-dimethyltransferase RsmA [Leptospira perolatii]|nr:16S rRNA (adenine(1518)-N(6)/adenine(1519)-N(6))-dimethyltransferase RsmA [Leptospira perolatii]
MKFPEYPFYKPSKIREFLESRSSAPLKKWGQNFLIDPNSIQAIFDSADSTLVQESELLIEIGPGLGALSHKLVQTGKKVQLYEIDPVYCNWLKEFLPEAEIIPGDVRESIAHEFPEKCYVFGNLPYYITSELILLCLENFTGLLGAVFLVQKEFAQRMTKEISSLGIYAGAYGTFKLKKTVKAGAFYPPPNVDSAILEFRANSRFQNSDRFKALELLCRVLFWGKRKKIGSSIKEAPIKSFYPTRLPFDLSEQTLRERMLKALEISKISTDKRPEELLPEEFYALAENF